jgi:hypothetical protein
VLSPGDYKYKRYRGKRRRSSNNKTNEAYAAMNMEMLLLAQSNERQQFESCSLLNNQQLERQFFTHSAERNKLLL